MGRLKNLLAIRLILALVLQPAVTVPAAAESPAWLKARGPAQVLGFRQWLINRAKKDRRSRPEVEVPEGLVTEVLAVSRCVRERGPLTVSKDTDGPVAYFSARHFGCIRGLSRDSADFLYSAPPGELITGDIGGGQTLAARLEELSRGRTSKDDLVLILAALKNQLVRTRFFRRPFDRDAFTTPSMAYFYEAESADDAVPADIAAAGREIMDAARPVWSDPKRVAFRIAVEKNISQTYYCYRECTCIMGKIQAAMKERGLAPRTVGMMNLAVTHDEQLLPKGRKYPGEESAAHLRIPGELLPHAAVPEQKGPFKLDSVERGFALSGSADPDPGANPTLPASRWNFHVAAAFVADGKVYVLDPMTARGPLTLGQWMRAFDNAEGRLLIESLSR